MSAGKRTSGSKVSIDVSDLTISDIDKALAAGAINDPVMSRLLEAARAKLLTRAEGPDPQPGAEVMHQDDHTDKSDW